MIYSGVISFAFRAVLAVDLEGKNGRRGCCGKGSAEASAIIEADDLIAFGKHGACDSSFFSADDEKHGRFDLGVVYGNGIIRFIGGDDRIAVFLEATDDRLRIARGDLEKLGCACGCAAHNSGGAHPVALFKDYAVYACGIERAQGLAEIIRVLNAFQQAKEAAVG